MVILAQEKSERIGKTLKLFCGGGGGIAYYFSENEVDRFW